MPRRKGAPSLPTMLWLCFELRGLKAKVDGMREERFPSDGVHMMCSGFTYGAVTF